MRFAPSVDQRHGGSAVSEMLHISAGFFDALDAYVQEVSDAAIVAHQEGLKALHSSVRKTARSHPRWRPLEEAIDLWHEDGEAFIGVRDPSKTSAAQDAEFGNENHPPAPVMRMMADSLRKAGDRMDEVLAERLGIPRHR